MNEKILAKAIFPKVKLIFAIVFFALTVLMLLLCVVVALASGDISYIFKYMEEGYFAFFVSAGVFLILGVICVIPGLLKDPEFTVSENKITGKTPFGKQVVLPVEQITAVGSGWFNRVSVSTASGAIRFCFIRNKDELFQSLLALINKD